MGPRANAGFSERTDTESPFGHALAAVRTGADAVEEARRLYARLTESERLDLLDGDEDFWPGFIGMITEGYNVRPYVHGAIERVGVPGLRFTDGPRGVVMGHSTAFPVSIARGATWDPSLEEEVGEAIGAEARAQGANFFGGVCINLPRHPAWGRIQETYGEDPILLGEMGAALVRGTQRHVMACVKHFALNSMENARFAVDVTCDEATLHEVYLAHFRRVVEEGVSGVMTAYNSLNGEWCGQNAALLEGVLRRDWGFRGVTVSDFVWGLRDASRSLAAGLDVEEPFRQQRGEHLPADLAAGRVRWEDVERSGLRVLATQLRALVAVPEKAPDPAVVACPQHRELAREVARRSMVLLRNEHVDGFPLLPLEPTLLRSMAVIGRLSDVPNIGDEGSSNVHAPSIITPLAGLRAALPGVGLRHVGDDDPQHAAEVAAEADVAVVVVGYTAADEGEYVSRSAYVRPDLVALYPPTDAAEAHHLLDAMAGSPDGASMVGGKASGGDRERLTLRPVDEEIIRRVVSVNPRTVVVLVTAGPVVMESWRHRVPGLVVAWYSGMEGGTALADILLGASNPSGRLPFSIPTSEEHLPHFDPHATSIVYDRWFGQRLLDKLGVDAAYPLGFGLSYSSFALSNASVSRSGERLHVTVDVTNTSERDGRHVVQVYGSLKVTAADGSDWSPRVLLGFAPIAVPAGGAHTLEFAVSLRPLARWDSRCRELVIPSAPVSVHVAAHAQDPDACRVTVPGEN